MKKYLLISKVGGSKVVQKQCIFNKLVAQVFGFIEHVLFFQKNTQKKYFPVKKNVIRQERPLKLGPFVKTEEKREKTKF